MCVTYNLQVLAVTSSVLVVVSVVDAGVCHTFLSFWPSTRPKREALRLQLEYNRRQNPSRVNQHRWYHVSKQSKLPLVACGRLISNLPSHRPPPSRRNLWPLFPMPSYFPSSLREKTRLKRSKLPFPVSMGSTARSDWTLVSCTGTLTA